MSFLNPVSEPVKRFSSTDAGAPQINYNARVAGDVKTVLKACLVTGYGAKASAGWSIVNEVDHVAEFVSPTAAMSDYRLGIDDTSASSMTWYYQYQDARTNPTGNVIAKNFSFASLSSADNGWQLLVTERGIAFIEIIVSSAGSKQGARITYWGQVKSAVANSTDKNIAFWCLGYQSPKNAPQDFFRVDATDTTHYNVDGFSALKIDASNITIFRGFTKQYGVSAVDLVSKWYLISGASLVAEQPGILLADIAELSRLYGIIDTTLDSRPMLKVCLTVPHPNLSVINDVSRAALLPLDYWEF